VKLAASLAALALTIVAARAAQAQEATDEPHRYPPSSARVGVLLSGGFMLGASYGGAAAMGAAWSDAPGADMLYIPVAGPWIGLGKLGCAPDEADSDGNCTGMLALRGILYVVDGLVQLGGLGVLAEGIFMTTEADGPAPAPKSAFTILPAPIVTDRSVGLGVVGAF
jgi:hypothetical protein